MSTPLPAPFRTPDRDAEAWLRHLMGGIRRDWWLILAILAAAVVMSLIFTGRQKRVYQSEATLLFQERERSMDLVSQINPMRGGPGAGGGIETDVAVLRSRMLAEAVAASLALNVHLLEPAIPRERVFQEIRVTEPITTASYELVPAGGGTYRLNRIVGESSSPLMNGVVPGRGVAVGGVTFTLSPALAAGEARRIRFSVVNLRTAADALRGGVTILRLDPKAEIVSIQYRHPDPTMAAAVPNVVAEEFIRYKQRTSQTESGTTVDFLRQQVASYERDLRAAEGRLQQFREQTQIVSLEDEASERVTRFAELQARRDQINTEAASLRQLLAEAVEGQRGSGDVSYRRLASFPSFFSNKAVQDILSSLMELENRRGDLLVRRTPENVDIQGLNQRISELENQLYQMARSYLASLENQRTSMDAELAKFGQQLETIPAREVQYARLARERELLANMYTLLQTRLKEAEIRNAAHLGTVRVLDPALVPSAPISPRPMYNLLMAVAFGLMLAGATVLTRSTFDRTVRTREEALAAAGGLPLLGAIPRIPGPAALVSGERNGIRARLATAGLRALPQRAATATDPLVTWRTPGSVVSEAFRGLRTNVALAFDGRPPRMVMVTSPMSGDGKSTSSANLAITYAQQGLRALLVDADMRNGTLRQLVGAPEGPGLAEVLAGDVALEEAIREVRVDDATLFFLGSGTRPHNPAELTASPAMRALVDTLREEYDIVVFDVPPLAVVTDALMMGKQVDAALLVARLGYTDREALEEAVMQLRRLQVPFEGLVLNDAPLPSRYYSYTG